MHGLKDYVSEYDKFVIYEINEILNMYLKHQDRNFH